jgi:3-deoxy-manno-octulosonate cytidylyltransferase (CMP-KDO synthetase)
MTIVRRIADDEELFNPDVVKVAVNDAGRALWFSRFPLPYIQKVQPGRRAQQAKFWAHIGVYAFRGSALKLFAAHQRTAMEKAESLEQLRVLELGGRMGVMKTRQRSVSVDSPADLGKLERLLP